MISPGRMKWRSTRAYAVKCLKYQDVHSLACATLATDDWFLVPSLDDINVSLYKYNIHIFIVLICLLLFHLAPGTETEKQCRFQQPFKSLIPDQTLKSKVAGTSAFVLVRTNKPGCFIRAILLQWLYSFNKHLFWRHPFYGFRISLGLEVVDSKNAMIES